MWRLRRAKQSRQGFEKPPMEEDSPTHNTDEDSISIDDSPVIEEAVLQETSASVISERLKPAPLKNRVSSTLTADLLHPCLCVANDIGVLWDDDSIVIDETSTSTKDQVSGNRNIQNNIRKTSKNAKKTLTNEAQEDALTVVPGTEVTLEDSISNLSQESKEYVQSRKIRVFPKWIQRQLESSGMLEGTTSDPKGKDGGANADKQMDGRNIGKDMRKEAESDYRSEETLMCASDNDKQQAFGTEVTLEEANELRAANTPSKPRMMSIVPFWVAERRTRSQAMKRLTGDKKERSNEKLSRLSSWRAVANQNLIEGSGQQEVHAEVNNNVPLVDISRLPKRDFSVDYESSSIFSRGSDGVTTVSLLPPNMLTCQAMGCAMFTNDIDDEVRVPGPTRTDDEDDQESNGMKLKSVLDFSGELEEAKATLPHLFSVKMARELSRDLYFFHEDSLASDSTEFTTLDKVHESFELSVKPTQSRGGDIDRALSPELSKMNLNKKHRKLHRDVSEDVKEVPLE